MRPSLLPGSDLEGVIASITEIQDILHGRLGFGHSGGTRPTIDNIWGTPVTVSFTATDTAFVVTHNLDIPVPTSGLNVRWLVMRVEHSGAGAVGASTMSLNHETGDSITANAFELRLYAEGTRTVGASPNDVQVDLFVVPAAD